MRLAATIDLDDGPVDVTGLVWEEERPGGGRGIAVILDVPHDAAEYRERAEAALVDVWSREGELAAIAAWEDRQ